MLCRAAVAIATCAVLASCASESRPRPLPTAPRADLPRIVSLEASATAFWKAARGQSIDRQLALWDELVEQPYAAFYEQVVWEASRHKDADARKRTLLSARLAEEAAIADELPRRFDEFTALARRHARRFYELFPDMTADVPIFAVLSPTFDAKGAILSQPQPRVVLAFGIDTITLYHENLDVIFPHEFFHVYHATSAGFLNDGVMAGVDLVVPLWEEGLATYVSSLFQPSADDGTLLLQDDLGRLSARDVRDLAHAFLTDATAKAIDPDRPEAFARWFSAGVPSVSPTTPNRSGYLLGLHVARRLAQTTSLEEVVHWRPPEAHDRALSVLHAIADGQ